MGTPHVHCMSQLPTAHEPEDGRAEDGRAPAQMLTAPSHRAEGSQALRPGVMRVAR
jgi:hypothetical protein